jgi:hypothetical protein
MKTISRMLIAAVLCAAAGAAMAVTGTPPLPGSGPALQDGVWLNGIAGGQNRSYQYGIAGAGTSSQATATQLVGGVAMYQVDTVAANSGVALPSAIAGTEVSIYNASGTTVNVYPSIANNGVTGIQDTINAGTSTTIATHVVKTFRCAKTGIWSAQ